MDSGHGIPTDLVDLSHTGLHELHAVDETDVKAGIRKLVAAFDASDAPKTWSWGNIPREQ
jgi:hypothetical protein